MRSAMSRKQIQLLLCLGVGVFFYLFIRMRSSVGFYNPFKQTDIETYRDDGNFYQTHFFRGFLNQKISETLQVHNSSNKTHGFFHQTSFDQVLDSFKDKTEVSCQNTCSINNSLCAATTFKDWTNLIIQLKLPKVNLLPPSHYIYPFEWKYLSSPPLIDLKTLPSLTLSKVFIKTNSDGVTRCQINEDITGHVVLFDDYGKERRQGGDEMRVWMTDRKTQQFKAAGHVTDFNNGSYGFSLRCLWPGPMQVNIAVAYPREYLRMAIFASRIGRDRLVAGRFWKNGIQEVTICHATPNVPGRPCLCNMTHINQQSFYCGRPLDDRLSCGDLNATRTLKIHPVLEFTQAEKFLQITIPGPASNRLIQHKVIVIVKDSGYLPSLPPCKDTNPKWTWLSTPSPQGYWSSNLTWTSLVCRRPDITLSWVEQCLQDTNIWLFGDSNAVQLWLQTPKTVEGYFWPLPGVVKDKNHNFTLSFSPHEYPLFLGSDYVELTSNGGVVKQIDNIPSTGKHILLFHYYLHLSSSHLCVAHARLTAARDAVMRLIKRNPDVTVAFRGPHTITSELQIHHAVGGDSLGAFYLTIVRDVFQDLIENVIFLDGWEMTISNENQNFHPDKAVPREMMRTLLAFKCY